MVLYRFEVLEIAGIGQFVEIENRGIGLRGESPSDECGSDEPRAARDDHFHSCRIPRGEYHTPPRQYL
jgi:hypothetical protein